MIACEPSTSCVSALPTSCSSAARRAVFCGRAQLGGHDRRDVRDLDRVAEHVLAVARAVLQAPEHLEQLGVQPGHLGVEAGLLAGAHDLLLDLLLGLPVALLDARRVDAPVGDQPLQRQARDLAAHAVEAREQHGPGRVVDDHVDAGEVLERADVAALAADDAALHLVRGQRHARHRRRGGVRGRRALDADRDDVAHAPVGLVARLVLDRADAAGDVVARLLLDAREQRLAGLRLRHRGDALELALLRLHELRRARLALGQRRVALGDAALARGDVGRELVELRRARAEPLLGARDLEAAALELLLDLAAGREHVLLGGDLRLLAHRVRLAAGARELALGLDAQRLGRAAAAAQHDERERSPDGESH